MENTTIRIRQAGLEDARLVAELSRRTFYETWAPHNTEDDMRIYLDEQFPLEKQMAEVGAPGRTFLLAYIGDELAGYASLRESDPPEGLHGEKAIEIVQLYSDLRFVGKGVGPALMQTCLDIAVETGNEWVWLGVWEHNHRAKAFYTKWGFERFGDHVFILGLSVQTDWWMRKRLS